MIKVQNCSAENIQWVFCGSDQEVQNFFDALNSVTEDFQVEHVSPCIKKIVYPSNVFLHPVMVREWCKENKFEFTSLN